MRRFTAAFTAILTLLVVAPATGDTLGVAVKDDVFSPKTRTVAVGDYVRFKWEGEKPHDVKFTKAPAGASKPSKCSLRTSGKCRRKLKKAGTYKYVCTIHLVSANMRGKIVVD